MKHRIGAMLGLTLMCGLLVPLALGGKEALRLLGQVPLQSVLLLMLMIFIGWNLNAGRIRLLVGGAGIHLGQRRALAVLMATEFSINVTPVGSGGPLTYAWLLGRHGLSRAQSLALYAVDHLIDMVFFLLAVLTILLYWLLMPQGVHSSWQMGGLAVFLLGSVGLLWGCLIHYRAVFLATGRLMRIARVSPRWRHKLARQALAFRGSLREIKRYSTYRLAGVMLLCTGHWLLRYSTLYLAVREVGGLISWSFAFISQMLALTIGQATLLPGGSGGTEASLGLLLAPSLPPAQAAAAILLWRFATFYWYLLAGAPVFFTLAGPALWRRLTTREDVG